MLFSITIGTVTIGFLNSLMNGSLDTLKIILDV